MRTQAYPSDVTDAQWTLISRLLPPPPRNCRPRTADLRRVVDAISYIARTGCQWRFLPKDFPPKSTVFRYFRRWKLDGTLKRIHDALRRKVRAAAKPGRPRRTASVDSQSVDTTSGGEARGRDNHKNVNGRKRHILVDSMGMLLAVFVSAADVDDAAAARILFERMGGQPTSRVRQVYADSKYSGSKKTSRGSCRSSGGPKGRKAGSDSRSAGSWSGPSHGSAAAAA